MLTLINDHDASKFLNDEYVPYDTHFYGDINLRNSEMNINKYNKAWLIHIQRNPHHWQHWVLIDYDPIKVIKPLDMPYCYILEMICDWWSFSWKAGNLEDVFRWYDYHKDYIKLSDDTRKNVEDILSKIKEKL